jgi:L-ascorbate metabolism protein UlaG (beta-lactamase superfamily)
MTKQLLHTFNSQKNSCECEPIDYRSPPYENRERQVIKRTLRWLGARWPGARGLRRWLGRSILYCVIALCLTITLVPPFLDRIYYEGPQSAHFDGARFHNPGIDDTGRAPTSGSRGSFILRWLTGQTDRAPWPDSVAVTPAVPEARVTGGAMKAIWVGHATMLVQADGLNILTDPIWSDVAGRMRIGPTRVTKPGIDFDKLPKIDVVVVSHNHYDHMDVETLKRLWDRDKPLIVTALGNDSVMKASGIPSKALDWGQRITVKPGVDVVVTRNHHWSSRFGVDRNRALWSSFVFTLPGGNVFFAGDTGFGDGNWPAEARALGPIRLALIPIGAFRFGPGMMKIGSHIGPIQSVEVFKRLGASFAIPVHWGTFQLSFEARDTPPRMLAEVMKCHALPDALFSAKPVGAVIDVPAMIPQPVGKPPAQSCLEGQAITALK